MADKLFEEKAFQLLEEMIEQLRRRILDLEDENASLRRELGR